MKIIDDFLPKEAFTAIQGFFTTKNCPWYLIDNVTGDGVDGNYFYMIHSIYENQKQNSDSYEWLNDIVVSKLNAISLLRIKANLYPNQGKPIHTHPAHTDYAFKHKAAILSLNTCNGGTQIGDEFVQSKENRIVIFDGSKPHSSTTCTDKQFRVNIGINYIDEDCITK